MDVPEIEIVWQDPPPKAPKPSLWADRLQPLQERPGQWAKIREDTPERITGLRSRLSQRVGLKDLYEFQTARIGDTRAELYARFQPAERRA